MLKTAIIAGSMVLAPPAPTTNPTHVATEGACGIKELRALAKKNSEAWATIEIQDGQSNVIGEARQSKLRAADSLIEIAGKTYFASVEFAELKFKTGEEEKYDHLMLTPVDLRTCTFENIPEGNPQTALTEVIE